MIRQRNPLGLWSLSSDSERCSKQRAGTTLSLTTASPLLTDTLTQTFLHSKLFPCIHTADHTYGKFTLKLPLITSGSEVLAKLCVIFPFLATLCLISWATIAHAVQKT